MLKPILVTALLPFLVLGPAHSVLAADPAARAPAPLLLEDPTPAVRSYLERRAVLLMIRATFGVVSDEDIPGLLADDLRRAGTPPDTRALAGLDADLLAEASYFIVSLKYLIESGGPIWPGDRPDSSYANDARIELEALQAALAETIASRADPLPLFERLVRLYALTEGNLAVPEELDRYRDRDGLVRDFLAGAGPRTST